MDTNGTLFWSAFGSFAGVIVFFLVRLVIEKIRSAKKIVTTYLCANEQNQGQATEFEGELMHHHGKRIIDTDDLKKFNANNPLWEWTSTPVGRGTGTSMIYGPYSTDFEEPGVYSAMFRIKSIGLADPKEITRDHILFELDVNATTPDYGIKQTGEIVGFNAQNKFARGYVRISHLAQKGWVDFELRFFSNAQGIWEYRILPNVENLAMVGPDVRIVFDRITIYKVPKLQIPNV